MSIRIKLYRSAVTTTTPPSLQHGEVGVNTTDKIMWVGNESNVPVPLFQSIFVQASNTTPVAPMQGSLWVQTDKELIFVREGGLWVSVTGFDFVDDKLEMTKDFRVKHDGTTFIETTSDVLGDGSDIPGVIVSGIVSEAGMLCRGELTSEDTTTLVGPTFIQGTAKVSSGGKLVNNSNGAYISWTNPAYASGRMYAAFDPPSGTGFAEGDIWFEVDPT